MLPIRKTCITICIGILSLSTLAHCASAPAGYEHSKRYLIAVLRVENRSGEKSAQEFLESVRGILVNELISSGRVRLIERDRVDVVFKEQALGQTGLIETDSAMRVGQLLGAQAVLLTRISALKTEESQTQMADARATTLSVKATLDTRLVHCETGEILAASDQRHEDSARAFEAGRGDVKAGSINKKALVGEVLQTGGRALARKLIGSIPAK